MNFYLSWLIPLTLLADYMVFAVVVNLNLVVFVVVVAIFAVVVFFALLLILLLPFPLLLP